jgi:hypothetical protein
MSAISVTRADPAFFPVDCIKPQRRRRRHKPVSSQIGKAEVAFHSSGLTSFAAALGPAATEVLQGYR